MNKIEADLKQVSVRDTFKILTTDLLEIIFVESKRELDKRFQENKIAGGELSAKDARALR